MGTLRSHIREIARHARLGDINAVNRELSAMGGDEVSFGRADADREMGRDRLPRLSKPMDLVAIGNERVGRRW